MEEGDLAVIFPDVIHHYQVFSPGRKQGSLSLGKAGIDWSVCGYHSEQLSGRPGYKKEQVHPDIVNAVRCLRANRKEKDDNLAVEQAYVQIPGI